jgi:peptide/nickel transport system permease protein
MHPGSLAQSIRREPFMLAVAFLLLAMVLVTVLVPLLSNVDADTQELSKRLVAPTWDWSSTVLGTDQLGRPMWIRLVEGLRTSLIVATLAVTLGAAIGVTAGVVAGYFGGRLDAVIMRAAEIQMALPGLLFAIAILSALGGGIVPLVIILGIDNWMLYARVSRTLVRSMRGTDFVIATQSLGAGAPRTIFRHLLPNTSTALVAVAAVELSRVMLSEAALSFLGFGVRPPTVSLGLILAEGRDYFANQWWVITLAGALLALAVLCVGLMGSWLRRVTDPMDSLSR